MCAVSRIRLPIAGRAGADDNAEAFTPYKGGWASKQAIISPRDPGDSRWIMYLMDGWILIEQLTFKQDFYLKTKSFSKLLSWQLKMSPLKLLF